MKRICSLLLCSAVVVALLALGAYAGVDIDKLVGSMTMREKLGQLNQLVFDRSILEADGWRESVRRGEVSSYIWFISDPKLRNEVQRVAVEESRLGIPLIFGMDIIHGCSLVFPISPALAGSFEPELFEKAQEVAAREACAEGLDWVFAPMCDTARDPRWGRVQETCGEDPYLNALCCAAQVRGFQGGAMVTSGVALAPGRVAACAKHYVAYSSVTGGRDYRDSEVSEWQLRNLHLVPFMAAIKDAGSFAVMSSFNSIDGIPAVANHHVLTDVLRGEWGFGGFVVSDWDAVAEVCNWGVAKDRREAAVMSLSAGNDMDMRSECYINNLEAGLADGKISSAAIDEAVRRVLRVKAAMGLFERPYVDETLKGKVWPESRTANAALARECVRKSVVLLKNDGGALPLDAGGIRRVALIGPFGDDVREMGGAWAGRFDRSSCVSLAAGLKAALPEAEIDVVKGCQANVKPKKKTLQDGTAVLGSDADSSSADVDIEGALAAARRADVVLVTVGETYALTGEANSRATLGATGRQTELFNAVASVGKPVVALVFAGRPLALDDVYGKAAAVLYCWQPGSEAGNGIADLLLGVASPSARLTMSVPWSVGEVPCYYNRPETGHQGNGWYKDMPKRWSRYPFGFGLTYSKFEYSAPRTEGRRVFATITNTGAREATETAQLYVRQMACREGWRPLRELRGFRRISLRPGESAEVSFDLTDETLGYFRRDGTRVCDSGEYRLWIAPDSNASGNDGVKYVHASVQPEICGK